MPRGTHSLQGLRCGWRDVCAKSCQTGYSFQKHRMLLQALCTADDYTPQCLMKSWHAERCKEHNTLLYILQNIRFIIAIHLLANDNLDSNNFARVSSISRIEDKNRVVQGGDLALQGGCLCWIHCFRGHLTPSLFPGLESVTLECWPRSCGPSLHFPSSVESCLLAWAAVSWLSLQSFLSLCLFLPTLLRGKLSLFLLLSRCYLNVPFPLSFPRPLHGEGKVPALPIFP